MAIKEITFTNVPVAVTEDAVRSYLTEKGAVVKSVKANRVVAVIGAVVDVQFDESLPPILDARNLPGLRGSGA